MRIRLGTLTVTLDSPDREVVAAWEDLFSGWQSADEPELSLALNVVETLQPTSADPPLYVDPRAIVDVYSHGSSYWLHFHIGAAVHVDQNGARGHITPGAVEYGQVEDVTYTALAPLLRRRGYYLLHAFAATVDGHTILLCGPSGTGKTTTGVSLLLHGWQLLANDVVLLEQRQDGIYALPTPGPLRVRPPTLFLLPALRHRPGSAHTPTASYIFPGEAVATAGWGDPAPIDAIYFPAIQKGASHSRREPLPQAVALAHLLEESVDRWDVASLEGHTSLLQTLVQQAPARVLHLAMDVDALPQLLKPEKPLEEP
jgi:hypothetical protein